MAQDRLEREYTAAKAAVRERLAYIDTIMVYVWPRPHVAELEAALEGLCGSLVPLGPMRKQELRWPASFRIHQPRPAALSVLTSASRRLLVTQIDVSLDLLVNDCVEAFELAAVLGRHLVQKRRQQTRRGKRSGETLYYGAADARNNLLLYATKPSKLNGSPCCHIEWRIHGAGAVKAAGLEALEVIGALDLHAFWEWRIVLRRFPTFPEMARLGRALAGNGISRRRRVMRLTGNKTVDADALHAGRWIRSSLQGEDDRIQDVLDRWGTRWSRFFPVVDCSWLLPSNRLMPEGFAN